MTHLANERVAYHNGKFLPESEVVISFRDRGFKFGEAVFDTARTIAHKPFKLREHVARLYKSLRYLNIDPKLTPDEMVTLARKCSNATRTSWVRMTTTGASAHHAWYRQSFCR